MAISKDNKRISVKFDNASLEKLQKLADKDNRSLSNEISTIVKNFLNTLESNNTNN